MIRDSSHAASFVFVRKSASELPFGKQPSRNPSPKSLVYLGVGFLAFLLSVIKESLAHVLSMMLGSNQE